MHTIVQLLGRSRRTTRLVLCVGAAAIALGVPATALAGSRGQQIDVYAPSQQSVMICGHNGSNLWVCHRWDTPGYGWTPIHNWWWKGTVSLYYYADFGGQTYLASTQCNVPSSQAGDWTYCYLPHRGNKRQLQYYWWGLRLWLNHNGTQAAWRSVAASGNFGNLSNLPVFGLGPFGNLVKTALGYPACIGHFVNAVRAADVGYGVVIDVNYWAPFWSCGSMKVWSQ